MESGLGGGFRPGCVRGGPYEVSLIVKEKANRCDLSFGGTKLQLKGEGHYVEEGSITSWSKK